ncbi:MAG: hypothetical protein JSS60_09030 [Verrucomicrobia bacterium]|nr:hypothetical protein [Verrucomicrobiota bacterium]
MKIARVLGILIIIAGIASILFSNYIMEQVAEGKIKIEKGEKAIKQGNQLFSLNPVAKEVGKGLTDSAQKKINEGQQQVAYYENLAQTLKTAGIAGIVVGAGIFLFSFMGGNKKRL